MFVAVADFAHIAKVGFRVAFYATKFIYGAVMLLALAFNDVSQVAKRGKYCKIEAVRDAIESVEIRENIFALEGDGVKGEEGSYF